jgi:hypothetical protein
MVVVVGVVVIAIVAVTYGRTLEQCGEKGSRWRLRSGR